VFNGLEAAEWWVKTYKKYPRWVILRSEIRADSVLDLFGSKDDRTKFGRIKQNFLKKHLESGGKENDFDIKTVFMAIGRKVEVIRCLVDASRLDKFVNFVVGYPQIQICVTKSGCITDTQKEIEGEL
jgi:hypothetical protein